MEFPQHVLAKKKLYSNVLRLERAGWFIKFKTQADEDMFWELCKLFLQ